MFLSLDGRLRINLDRNEEQIDPFSSIEGMLNGELAGAPKKMTKGLVRLERAPNAVVFIEAPKFLAGPKLFPVQYQIVRDFHELLCPVCNDIEKIQLTDEISREDQILFEYNICPNCGLPKSDIADE